jgi:hypothetical protein
MGKRAFSQCEIPGFHSLQPTGCGLGGATAGSFSFHHLSVPNTSACTVAQLPSWPQKYSPQIPQLSDSSDLSHPHPDVLVTLATPSQRALTLSPPKMPLLSAIPFNFLLCIPTPSRCKQINKTSVMFPEQTKVST